MLDPEKLKKLALKHALKNALRHNGKAMLQAVITGAISEKEEIKKNIKEFVIVAKKIIQEINKISLKEQEELFKKEFPNEPIKIEKEKKEFKNIIKDILGIKDGEKVISAFPPEPSKYPHLGHIKGIIINYTLAKSFNGKFILRFEDTNQEKIKKEYYDAILDTCKWLDISVDEIIYASKNLEIMYRYAEELIKKGDAYVCNCKKEIINKNRREMKECPHRSQSIKENLELFKKLKDTKEGEFVVRMKIDMSHKNTTMRDPIIIRIMDVEHPIVGNKYRLWPTYDFETAVLDGHFKVNYRFRSKEFEMRSELHNYIQRRLGLTITKYGHYARFNIKGVPSSGRVIREAIENKKLMGWDDPRLTTVISLKKRGFLPETIKEFVLNTGFSKHEGVVTWDALESINRRILDPIAKRYFFISEPVEIKILDTPIFETEIRHHPENKSLGKRKFKINGEFYIEKKDYEKMISHPGTYRLMELMNIKVDGNKFFFDSKEYKKEKNIKGIIHWIPKGYEVKARVLMPNAKIINGFGERYMENIKVGEVIQAERFGFMCLEDKNPIKFRYTHK